jgi:hypothetical protein
MRILVLQDMVKRIIDFEAIHQVTRLPVHHVWVANWNRFFSIT